MKETAIHTPAPKPPAKRKAKPSEKADMDFVHPDYLSNVPVVIGKDDQALIGFPSISSGSVMVCPAKGAKTGKEWRELPVGTIRLSECAVSIALSAPEPTAVTLGDNVMCMGKNLVEGCPNYDPHGCRAVFGGPFGHWNADKQTCETTMTFGANAGLVSCSALIDRTITCTYTPEPEK
jgi:hypothetical protein